MSKNNTTLKSIVAALVPIAERMVAATDDTLDLIESGSTVFIPSVSAAGVISWTNDGNKQNPQPVDIVSLVLASLPSARGVSF